MMNDREERRREMVQRRGAERERESNDDRDESTD